MNRNANLFCYILKFYVYDTFYSVSTTLLEYEFGLELNYIIYIQVYFIFIVAMYTEDIYSKR